MSAGHQTCKKCQKEMRFEFSIKDEIWNKLPEKWHNRCLCVECFLEELETTYPDLEIRIEDFYFIGIVGAGDGLFGGILRDIEKMES